ncbi:hypothetical protein Drorol1_Dr00010794 [Drosera rotundifolia]
MVVRKSGIKMPSDRHFARIDIFEMRAILGRKLGARRADKYFQILNEFFSSKISKSEFDRLCIATIGRENRLLHNTMLQSVFKNASQSKTPPPRWRKIYENSVSGGKVANGYQRTCLQSFCRDALPPSPRRGRTPGRGGFKEKPSPLGPHGKPQALAVGNEDLTSKAREQQSATELLLSPGSRPLDVVSVEDGEEVDQTAISPGVHSRSPVTAPFGVPINVKVPRKVFSPSSLRGALMESCQRSGELPDTRSLMKRLEQKVKQEGLKISPDFGNLLNNSIDVFLKRLIKPSLDLAASRRGSWQRYQAVHSVPGLNGNWPVRYSPGQKQPVSVSLLDFRTAMEENPGILGEDWPTQLEKIYLREFESC